MNNIENLNNNSLNKMLKDLTTPNGFKIKKEKINDKILLENHFIINDLDINEKIFIKFYAHIDPYKNSLKKFTKKNKNGKNGINSKNSKNSKNGKK
mgnify:FL=1